MIRMAAVLPQNTRVQAPSLSLQKNMNSKIGQLAVAQSKARPHFRGLAESAPKQRLRSIHVNAAQPSQQGSCHMPHEAIDKVLEALGQNVFIINTELTQKLNKVAAGQSLLLALHNKDVGFIPGAQVTTLKDLIKHDLVTSTNAQSYVGQDAGLLLVKAKSPEAQIRQQIYGYCGGAGFDQFWPIFAAHFPWENNDSPGKRIVSNSVIVPLSPALDFLSQQLVEKVNNNTLTKALVEVYQFALESFGRGGMDEATLDAVREKVLVNMTNVFHLQSKELQAKSNEMASLVTQTQDRFILGSMRNMLVQYENTLHPQLKNGSSRPVVLAQRPNRYSPVYEASDLKHEWTATTLARGFRAFDPSKPAYLTNTLSEEWSTFGLGQEHMPMMIIKAGATKKDVSQILKMMTGSLILQNQHNDFLKSIAAKVKGATQPKFESMARLRQDVHHMFWLKVVNHPDVKRAKYMAGLAGNHFFSFPSEIRTALIANYGLVFQEKSEEVFASCDQPALLVSSDHMENLSKRVMFGTMASQGDTVASTSAHLRKMIQEEFGDLPSTYIESSYWPTAPGEDEGPTDASYDGDLNTDLDGGW